MLKYYTNLPLLCSLLDQFRHDCKHDPQKVELIEKVIEMVVSAYGNGATEKDLYDLSVNQRNAGRKSSLTNEQKLDIIQRHRNGETLESIAKTYNCSISQVHKIAGNHRF